MNNNEKMTESANNSNAGLENAIVKVAQETAEMICGKFESPFDEREFINGFEENNMTLDYDALVNEGTISREEYEEHLGEFTKELIYEMRVDLDQWLWNIADELIGSAEEVIEGYAKNAEELLKKYTGVGDIDSLDKLHDSWVRIDALKELRELIEYAKNAVEDAYNTIDMYFGCEGASAAEGFKINLPIMRVFGWPEHLIYNTEYDPDHDEYEPLEVLDEVLSDIDESIYQAEYEVIR